MRDRVAPAAVAGCLGALSAALRIPFAALPNVQPATALVITTGMAMGPTMGANVGVLTALLSNVVLGHGPWTVFQALAWGLVGFISGLLPRMRRAPLAAWGFVAALLFGLIMDAWLWWAFATPHNLPQALFIAGRSLPWNLLHAATTAAILWWFGPRLDALLSRGRVTLLGRPPRRPPAMSRTTSTFA